MTFRIERTELHTRVWPSVEDEDEEHSFHSGHPIVRIRAVTCKAIH